MLFARHGEMEGDPFVLPPPGVRGCLSPQGVEQAARLGRALASEPIDRAFASPMGRALQTAEIALAGRDVTIQLVPGLHEWMPDRNLENLPATDHESIVRASDGLPAEQTWKTPMGEGCFDMYARIVPGFVGALNGIGIAMRHGGYVPAPGCENLTLAVFAHGGSLAVLLSFLLGLRPFPVGGFQFDLCGLAEIRFVERVGVYYPALRIPTPPEPEARP